MINLSIDILINISSFLKINEVLIMETIFKKLINNEGFNKSVWKKYNNTMYDILTFKKLIKNIHFCYKNDLCNLCKMDISKKKNMKIICNNCADTFNTNSNMFKFHLKCYHNMIKFNRFSNIFNCSCLYCNLPVMAMYI